MTGTNGYIDKQIGNYRIIKKLGKGGFGEVYLGEHIHLKRLAAIKLLLKTGDQDAFRKEAQIIARLEHPNIVRILEFGIDGETPFLIMDYAPNGTLRQHYSNSTQIPLKTILSYTQQLANALQYAHNERIIHRDVKPENMLLGRRNEVLLSDFGLALLAQSSRYQSAEEIIGTIAYMAPEQLQGRSMPASDQYALAVVVYEWLSGSVPFHGTIREICVQHLNLPPPSLQQKIPTLPSAVERVVMRALAKEPRDRFPNIQAFATALERASLGQTVPISPLPSTTTETQTSEEPILSPAPSFEERWANVVQAQARGDSERTFRLLLEIWRSKNLTFSQRELVKSEIQSSRQMISWCMQLARKASAQGNWQVEIRLWEVLLALDLSQQEFTEQLTLSPPTPIWGKKEDAMRERLRIAQQNEQHAWMYAQAQQFISTQVNAAARKQLEALWRQAPFYGDPAGLAPIVGLSPNDNYEQALAKKIEEARIEEEKRTAAEQARQRTAALASQREEAKQKHQKMIRVIAAEIWAGIIVGGVAGVLLALLSWILKTSTPVTPAQITTVRFILGLEKVLAIFVNFPEWVSAILVGAFLGWIIGVVVGCIEAVLDYDPYPAITGRIVGLLAGAIILGAIGGLFGYLGAAIGLLVGAVIGVWIVAWLRDL